MGSQEQEAAISPSEHFLQADDLRECNAMTMSDCKERNLEKAGEASSKESHQRMALFFLLLLLRAQTPPPQGWVPSPTLDPVHAQT